MCGSAGVGVEEITVCVFVWSETERRDAAGNSEAVRAGMVRSSMHVGLGAGACMADS